MKDFSRRLPLHREVGELFLTFPVTSPQLGPRLRLLLRCFLPVSEIGVSPACESGIYRQWMDL